jgi:hypothetical protein
VSEISLVISLVGTVMCVIILFTSVRQLKQGLDKINRDGGPLGVHMVNTVDSLRADVAELKSLNIKERLIKLETRWENIEYKLDTLIERIQA